MGTTTRTDRLTFTGDDEADRLLVAEPLALLIGFALDQQVTVQKAFTGPLELHRRLGTLDAAKLAAIEPATLADLFRQRPAIHRFPGSMAGKVQALCAAVAQRLRRRRRPHLDRGGRWPRPRKAAPRRCPASAR